MLRVISRACRLPHMQSNYRLIIIGSRSFAKSFGPETDPNEDFSIQFRRSKFVELGDPNGKVVAGRIIRVVKNDLYIDFGGKFPCVCKRPSVDGELYTAGRTVRIRLHDLELSTKFLGSDLDLSLCEADATLLGLFRSKAEIERQQVHRQKQQSSDATVEESANQNTDSVDSKKPASATIDFDTLLKS